MEGEQLHPVADTEDREPPVEGEAEDPMVEVDLYRWRGIEFGVALKPVWWREVVAAGNHQTVEPRYERVGVVLDR